MSACGCCEEIPCPAPSLECDAISQSKSKIICGYSEFGTPSSPAIYYGTKTVHSVGSSVNTTPGNSISQSFDFTEVYQKSIVDGVCVETLISRSGSSSSTGDSYDGARYFVCESTLSMSGWSGTYKEYSSYDDSLISEGAYDDLCTFGGISFVSTTVIDSVTSETVYSWGAGPGGGTGTQTITTTLSDVSTESTESLIDRTVAALPTYPATYSGSCSSFRNLSTDETSYSIRRTKWRLVHEPTGTCYLKVWLQKRFSPEGGGPDTVTALTPYEWTGSGNPCFASPMLPPGDESNIIRSGATEETEPPTDGTTAVEIVKWSCVPGYTPPDNGSANGYPVPE